jgi:5-methylthioadenosine/S-adenosylhomocysteine deaminase
VQRAGLQLLDRAGLLNENLLLIHGNHPAAGEIERIARSGAAVVHCPGTHRFFDREAFPMDAYRRAGIPMALGTDSLASNEDLDMGREMQLASESFPEATPPEIFRWATEGGARALGWGDRLGRLEAGFEADFVQHAYEPKDAREATEVLLGCARVSRVWVAGREVWANRDA